MRITIGAGVSLSARQIRKDPVFKDWVKRLPSDWNGRVKINEVDAWGNPKQVHMIQLTVFRRGSKWPVRITLRSETVDIVTIVTDGTQRWVVFVEQEREAAGGRVISNPAGGRDWTETPEDAAKRELREELGLSGTKIEFGLELRRLLPEPVLASPGITAECAHMFYVLISVAPHHLKAFLRELHGKRTGEVAEGEDITLIVKPAKLARSFIVGQSLPDAKTLLGLGLAPL